ncbi:hypothetical protein M422DRAFT_249886 [Sphaerobolus stellatus SS14]|uniref:PLL-like beta propeller domain-containing protein n=1 Tax=Sphaerobolus stellatus (strain SS14) TaxID=990650 RepID=A0A0C9VUS0_SPHS4|nr:hypothetical protein M422DRAFT_249886 [Sphaerobolus stellatus SS14]
MYWLYGLPDSDALTPYHATPGSWKYEFVSISPALNNFSLFLVSMDHALHQSNFNLLDTADFTPWKRLGGKLTGPPAVCTRQGTIHIYHRGIDAAIYHNRWDGKTNTYSPQEGSFERLDGIFVHTLTACSPHPDESMVFAVGAIDGCLHYSRWKAGEGHGPFQKLPGTWLGSPKAISDKPGCWDVFGVGPRGQINRVTFRSSIDEQPRFEIIDAEVQAVEAVSWGPGRIDLFGHDYRGSTLHRSWNDGELAWTSWEDLGGVILQVAKAVTHAPGGLNIFGTGTDLALWRNRRDRNTGKWGGWKKVGGVIIDRPG